jgi:hypothetical protein
MRALFALFQRSLREDTRARLPPILRATLVLVILLIIWGNHSNFTRRSAPGREFLGMALFANLGLIAIATVGIFSSAITEEKEDQTLTLLRMTRLSPLAILFGKSTTRLIGALLLLAVQIPFTLLAVTLGGVSLAQVLGSYAILGATTFFLCNLALLCSVTCRTTIRAGLWTGVIAGMVYAVLPVIGIVTALQRMRPGSLSPQTPWEYIATWLTEANPIYSLALLLFERSAAAPVAKHAVLNLSAGLLCFLLSWLLFDRFCATAGEVVLHGKRTSGGSRGIWRVRSRPSVSRSLAWKDFYFLIGGLRGLCIRFVLCGLVFFGAYAFARWVIHDHSPSSPRFWHDVGEVTMVFAIGIFALEIAFAASRIFGEERRNLTLGSLLTLPRTTGWLIRQKLLACLPVVVPSIALFELGLWLVQRSPWIGYSSWGTLSPKEWMAIFYISSQALLLPMLIAYLSLRIRRGGLPAGIAIVIVFNVFTAVLMDLSHRGSTDTLILAALGIVSCVMTRILAAMTFRAIPGAGAAE